MKLRNKFRAGDWVEVRSKEEILRTLDKHGRLEGMPFMPEMFSFCGKRLQVYMRAHKTCDTVFPVRGRRVHRTVHLETRCEGSAHGGCQTGCLIFWKEDWLRPIPTDSAANLVLLQTHASDPGADGCTESDVWSNAKTSDPRDGTANYHCQATQLPYATSDLSWWDLRQYLEDYFSGNVNLADLARGTMYSAYYNLSQVGVGLGRPMRWFYERICWLWGRSRFPRAAGDIPNGQRTPVAELDLQPGELVRVKSHEEILRTVTVDGKNRGMSFDAEMVPYCGGTFRVLKRVSQIVDEKTGKLQTMKNPCIILNTVVCQGRYSGCRMFCPRSLYPFWREIWLERVALDESPACAVQAPVDISEDSGSTISRRCSGERRDPSERRGLVEIGKD